TVRRTPFRALGAILFGEERLRPCPYCRGEGSHFDLGDLVGFCYGPCGKVPLARLHEPFFRAPQADADADADVKAADSATTVRGAATGKRAVATAAGEAALPVITLTQDAVLEIDPARVGTLVLRFKRPRREKKNT